MDMRQQGDAMEAAPAREMARLVTAPA